MCSWLPELGHTALNRQYSCPGDHYSNKFIALPVRLSRVTNCVRLLTARKWRYGLGLELIPTPHATELSVLVSLFVNSLNRLIRGW